MKSKIMTSLAYFSSLAFSYGEFHDPMILSSNGLPIDSSGYGYAAPCLADVDLDGVDELLVGRFTGGNIAIYEINDLTLGENQLGEKRWLIADGEKAGVPGVG